MAASDNTKVHGPFHALFRDFQTSSFVQVGNPMFNLDVNFVESLNLPRLVTCNLNPLRTCPPQVTRAFSSVTRSHQVVYCQSIIEKNSRHTLLNADLQYDEWFPYDPYSLPKSGKIIWPLCIEYKDWSKDGDEETQYSGMKRKLEADDDDYLLMASPTQKLVSSLSNCISPGFRTSESIMM
ncbi:RNA polymerase I specific transcription initiation factor RRN3 domain-containing protein [Phthorimaea operculella]|nr:RNA polymerase I specific transcription initiation factor RRN3 domain-containing protein [Phthorimaea operculella]